MSRSAALWACCCAALLIGGEWPPITVTAARSSFSLQPDRVNESEDLHLRYEAITLACARLQYVVSALPGATRVALAQAALVGGPEGRVLCDSAATRLPEIPFRGVLRPRQVLVERLPDSTPAQLRLRVLAEDLGDIAGEVVTERGARPHVAWAERAVLELVAAAADSRLGFGPPRLVALHLYGRPGTGEHPARPAVVLRLRAAPPPEAATAERLRDSPLVGMRASGLTMSLHFDEQGRLASYESDTGDYAVSDGEDFVPRFGSSLPRPR
ncbi:MAG: hypothetical protein RMM29_09160 [Planctomycetota bacterium]|nr:hypothetical protein [Planctomycetota bacterium]MCX8040340.1 hypothetical protein [Planctomycetota bacterium]MDW8373796.1 hypothetical protein [Planctomycetota bacterium]